MKAPKRPARNRVEISFEGARAAAFASFVQRRAYRYLRKLGLEGCELSIALVGDREIRRLNRHWRKKDQATDVLSFPAGEAPRSPGARRPLGDVAISIDTAQRVARQLRRAVNDELACYLAHGLLHLLGHDHHGRAERERMKAKERLLLGRVGLIDAGEPSDGLTGDGASPSVRKEVQQAERRWPRG